MFTREKNGLKKEEKEEEESSILQGASKIFRSTLSALNLLEGLSLRDVDGMNCVMWVSS